MADGDTQAQSTTAEHARLEEARGRGIAWKQWGPYLSERQWGTVREDYSENGDAWDYFTHDQARSRAYHWGEDGIAGLSDDRQRLCFALALWNGKDPILKERMFGLTNSEGNHGEDVKEYYFYLDSTPTHSYMKFLYKYPQEAYPYDDLVVTNSQRGRKDMEYELIDTGIFDGDRYFDVFVEYAKQGPTDILIQISISNRGPEAGRASSPAHAVVPQHLELVAGNTSAVPERRGRDAGQQRRRRHRRRARDLLPALRRRPAAALHRERDEQSTPFRHGQRSRLRQGRHQRLRHGGPAGCGQSAAGRDQGGRALPGDGGRRADHRDPLATDQCVSRIDRQSVRRLRRHAGDSPARGRRVLQPPDAERRRRRRRERDAAGLGRDAVDQAVLLLRCREVAARTWRRSAQIGHAGDAEQRLAAHGERACHLDAGQVGISLVRRLGSRLPDHRPRRRRCRLRQAAARSAAAGLLPPSDRPDARL